MGTTYKCKYNTPWRWWLLSRALKWTRRQDADSAVSVACCTLSALPLPAPQAMFQEYLGGTSDMSKCGSGVSGCGSCVVRSGSGVSGCGSCEWLKTKQAEGTLSTSIEGKETHWFKRAMSPLNLGAKEQGKLVGVWENFWKHPAPKPAARDILVFK
eukprot:scaffold39307_cov17-Tisochrysis_lutea.AAC.2